jgi:hypothetical protein
MIRMDIPLASLCVLERAFWLLQVALLYGSVLDLDVAYMSSLA